MIRHVEILQQLHLLSPGPAFSVKRLLVAAELYQNGAILLATVVAMISQ